MTAPALLFYRAATTLFAPFARIFLRARARQGKEDVARMGERMGFAVAPRPQGPLVWLHGASIGEGLSLLPLIEAIVARGAHALVTTGTTSSARVVTARLPPGASHQFVPLDSPPFVDRFIRHWRPDVAIFAESELWPNLIAQTRASDAPVMLVNARMSPRSFERWRLARGAAAQVLGQIEIAFAQSRDDAARLTELGARDVRLVGNLKYDVAAPPSTPDTLAALSAQIGSRPVWVAASTHPGEEEICLAAHRNLLARFPDLLTIVAPRDARRGAGLEQLATRLGDHTARRSDGQPISAQTQVYIADTFGEMGLWYRLASVVFVGKSLAGVGGQNPIEAAKLGAAVLHGPSVENFVDAYAALDAAGGGVRVTDAADLATQLAMLFADVAKARAMARAAVGVVRELGGATESVMQAIEPYLAHTRRKDA